MFCGGAGDDKTFTFDDWGAGDETTSTFDGWRAEDQEILVCGNISIGSGDHF